jgi:hypothetical protein
MKLYQLILIIGSLLTFTPFIARSQDKELLTVPLSEPGKEGKLKVGLVTGTIKVIGYEGKEVIIEAVSGDKDDRKGHTEKDGMKKISTNSGFELIAKESSNTVTVSVSKPNMKMYLTIKVPRKFSLKLNTVNDGDILVENVTGNLEVNNVNGYVKLKNVGGSVVASTVNDDVVVNFTEVTPNTPMAFTTLNGNVDITFPANVKTNIKVKSDRGEVYSDFEVEVDKTTSKIKQFADGEKGTYVIKKDDWTYGKINGGGAEMMMKTMNGDIFIRKAK